MSVHSDSHSVVSSSEGSYSDMMHNDYYSEDSGSVHKVSVVPRGYHTIRRMINRKLQKISFYETTNTPNYHIRNAISGHTTSYRVGTYDEDLFFSVLLCTGETGQNAPLLFYDTPEQYEQHFGISLPEDAKEQWRVKYYLAVDKLKRKAPKSESTKILVGKRQSYATIQK